MKPGAIGEANLGALIGSCIGSITGLFAIGIAPAIIESNAQLVIAPPKIGLICFVLGGLFGWFAGGALGHKLAHVLSLQRAHVTAGIISGLLPFVGFVLFGWLYCYA